MVYKEIIWDKCSLIICNINSSELLDILVNGQLYELVLLIWKFVYLFKWNAFYNSMKMLIDNDRSIMKTMTSSIVSP